MKIFLIILSLILSTGSLQSQTNKNPKPIQKNVLQVDSPIKVVITPPLSNTIHIDETSEISLKQKKKTTWEELQPYMGIVGVLLGFVLSWGLNTRTRKKDRQNVLADKKADRDTFIADNRIRIFEKTIESLKKASESQISITFKMRRMINETINHNFNWRFLELELSQDQYRKYMIQPLIDNQIAEYNSKKGQYQDLVGAAASLFQRFVYYYSKEEKEKHSTLMANMLEFNMDVFLYVVNNKDKKDYNEFRLDGRTIDAVHVRSFIDEVLNPIQDMQRKTISTLEEMLYGKKES